MHHDTQYISIHESYQDLWSCHGSFFSMSSVKYWRYQFVKRVPPLKFWHGSKDSAWGSLDSMANSDRSWKAVIWSGPFTTGVNFGKRSHQLISSSWYFGRNQDDWLRTPWMWCYNIVLTKIVNLFVKAILALEMIWTRPTDVYTIKISWYWTDASLKEPFVPTSWHHFCSIGSVSRVASSGDTSRRRFVMPWNSKVQWPRA